MKTLKTIILKIFIIGFVLACSNDDSNNDDSNDLNAAEYYEELNISYGSDSDQVFDLYLPANRTSATKIMILIHGGAWIEGDKADMNAFKDIFRQDLPNIAIVNMNYRLADQNNLPLPMQTDDITSVISFLKSNQSNYTISNDFGFLGTSAGGHLALLWSYAFDTDNDIEMVCSVVGPTNLADPAYTENPIYDPLFEVFGDDLTTEYLENASPLFNVNATSPPTILFYGGQDPLVPTSQGVALNDSLNSLGVTHEFTLYEDEGHGWVGLNLLDTWTKLKAFTQAHL